jgi:hypothetical protein
VANGIKIGSQEVFADFASNGLRFTFRDGGLQSLPSYRGEDDVIPQASGRAAGLWVADVRELALHGIVQGSGSDAQSIRESFKTAFALIVAAMDPTALVTVTVYNPHFGLAAAGTATLTSCRPMRIIGPDPAELAWYEVWEGDLQLTCIKSPPNWTVA